MTQLQKNAMARVPIPAEEMEKAYSSGQLNPSAKRIAESHERLRLELHGCESLVAQLEKALAEAKALMLAMSERLKLIDEPPFG